MWKTFKAEFEALWKSRLRFVSWVILLFMPLIYGMLFLSSFWSPFKNTDKLPIVVVNLDVTSNPGDPIAHSPASRTLVEKLTNHGDPLEFTGGSSSYKINVKDAKDIYTSKEEVEKKVNDGTYSAAFVIPKGYGKNIEHIKTTIFNDILSTNGNVDIANLIKDIDDTISKTNNGLIDFYNSFKTSYVAGEMTNMGSSLYRLLGDLIFPDISTIQPVIDSIEKEIPAIASQLAKAQITGIGKAASGIIASVGPDTVHTAVAAVMPMIQGMQTKLAPLLSGTPQLETQITQILTDLGALAVSTTPTDYPALIKKVTDGLTSLNLSVHNLNIATFQPIIDAVKTKILGDLAKGNALVDHRTYGKREGVVGKRDILNTYGFGLAPYFLSIVLWAGALLMAFLFPNKRYIKTEGTFKNLMGKTFVWILTGWIQVLLLFAVISIPGIFGSLSYNINGHIVTIQQCINIGGGQWKLILFALFMSTMFMLIVRGILYTLRVADIGMFVCVVLLILQLVSSGGTFPVSMQPAFFSFLHTILPFTYTVGGIREIFWDTDALVVMKDVGVLLIIPTIVTITSYIAGYFWDKKTHYKVNGQTRYRSMDKNVGSL